MANETEDERAARILGPSVDAEIARAMKSLNAETVVSGRVNELWPGGPELPAELESYIDCTGKRCYRPRGEGERLRFESRLRRLREVQAHEDALRREMES